MFKEVQSSDLLCIASMLLKLFFCCWIRDICATMDKDKNYLKICLWIFFFTKYWHYCDFLTNYFFIHWAATLFSKFKWFPTKTSLRSDMWIFKSKKKNLWVENTREFTTFLWHHSNPSTSFSMKSSQQICTLKYLS